MDNVFIIESMTLIDDLNIASQVLGVYTSNEKAESALKTLVDTKDKVHVISELEVDTKPLSDEDVYDEIEQDLKALMDLGIVDQLVGEDGNFYYTLIEKKKDNEEP